MHHSAGRPRDLYRYYSTNYPSSRFAFLGFEQDPTNLVRRLRAHAGTVRRHSQARRQYARPASELEVLHRAGPEAHDAVQPRRHDPEQEVQLDFRNLFPHGLRSTTNLATFLTKMYTDDPTWAKQSSLAE